MIKLQTVDIDPTKIKVKRWSFCKPCKGSLCPKCSGKGVVVEEIFLSNIPVRVQPVYIAAQKDFIDEQLGVKI